MKVWKWAFFGAGMFVLTVGAISQSTPLILCSIADILLALFYQNEERA